MRSTEVPATRPGRSDRDEWRQVTGGPIGCDVSAETWVRHAPLWRIAGVHQVAGALMVALLGGQRADQRELMHARGEAGEVLG